MSNSAIATYAAENGADTMAAWILACAIAQGVEQEQLPAICSRFYPDVPQVAEEVRRLAAEVASYSPDEFDYFKTIALERWNAA